MGKQDGLVKRFTDIILSILILLITSPFLIISAIAIKLESKGPIIFKHERIGKDGKIFIMYKFRGMIDNALSYGPELTQVNDPRITKVGKILRRTSIDELPNFFNVLKGDMSIVGPRPEIPSIATKYDQSQQEIFKFKPGVTGFSQINGRQLLKPDERVRMEIDYYGDSNFFSDLMVIFRTISVVITNQGNL
ncbi:MAG: sugar transferase [Ignavibacteriaceae bacterium]|nr:sugar transferase [Ignavibacteriaceae bacterium]